MKAAVAVCRMKPFTNKPAYYPVMAAHNTLRVQYGERLSEAQVQELIDAGVHVHVTSPPQSAR